MAHMSEEYHGPHRRAYDREKPWRFAHWYAKWAFIINPLMFALMGGVATILGLHVVGPAYAIAQTNAHVSHLDSIVQENQRLNDARFAEGAADRNDLRAETNFLVRIRCTEMTDAEINRLGGNDVCDAALHPIDHAKKLGLTVPGSTSNE